MQSKRQFFGGRVGRNVFSSFLVASIVPIAVTAVLALTQVTQTLEHQARQQLGDASRNIGQQLLDRLLIAQDALGYLAAGAELTDSVALAAAQIVTSDEQRMVFGAPFDAPEVTIEGVGRTEITIRRGEHGYDLFLGTRTRAGAVIGKVDASYLWETSALLPFAMNFCVISSESWAFVYCTDPLAFDARAEVLSSIARASSGNVKWVDGSGEVLAAHWELFLPSRFEARPWSVVVSQPAGVALASVQAFNHVFPTVIAVSLILIVLLSASQIRRIMKPLQQLVAGTRNIAEQRFSARVELSGSDEFAELAQAMNDMAARLGRQFETINALAEVDRLILSSRSIEHVLESILDRIGVIEPTCGIAVLLIDPDQRDRGRIFSRAPGDGRDTVLTRVAISAEARSWLARVSAGSIGSASVVRKYIEQLPDLPGYESVITVPIFRGEDLRGTFVAQIPRRDSVSAHETERLTEFASRLAVAIAVSDHEKELFDQAHFDALTGLPNRQLCYDRLHQALAHAKREQHQLAVLFIDLDRFKNVNDSLGHALGDELLRETAARLTASVRDTDTVARLGGDEYVVILPHIHGVLEVETVVNEMLNQLKRPFSIDGHTSSLSASIGVTLFPEDGRSADELLRRADTAMYAAKSAGRARSVLFQEEMDLRVQERFAMQEDILHALENEQFGLVYQPELDLESGRLICVESLLRWQHPERGMVPPAVFVPILEDLGLIIEVGRWIFETALADYVRWGHQGLQLPRVSINVSGRQLLDQGFAEFVLDAVRKHGLEGRHLELELTEHSLIADFANANRVLGELSAHGVRIAIDDFGTGYSSLGYLQGLHFDVLKIDRAFVKDLPANKSVAIVQAIVAVARALDREVIAEGIETDAQHTKLVELGCNLGQGYLFSLPVTGEELVSWAARLDASTFAGLHGVPERGLAEK